MAVLVLPSLVVGRTMAANWVHNLGDIDGQRVVLDASPVINSTASFAAQVVRSTVVDGGATNLVVIGGPAEFGHDVKLAAEDLGVSEQVSFAADDPELWPQPRERQGSPDPR